MAGDREETMEKTKSNKKIIAAAAAAVVIVALMVILYIRLRPEAAQGSKSITITVVAQDGTETSYSVQTDAEYLRGAIEDAEGLTVEGTESEYGLMVDTVNGVRADYTLDGAYWSFLVNGEYCNYGVDEQVVNDGDEFQIVYTPA